MRKLSALFLVVVLLSTGCISTQYKTVTTGAPGVTKYLTTITVTDAAIGGETHTITNTIINTVTTAINNGVTVTKEIPTTVLGATTVVIPPVTLPAQTVTTTITATPIITPTLANSVSLLVSDATQNITDGDTNALNYSVSYSNSSAATFNNVKISFIVATSAPVTRLQNMVVSQFGSFPWQTQIGTSNYTFVSPVFTIYPNGSGIIPLFLNITWRIPPPNPLLVYVVWTAASIS